MEEMERVETVLSVKKFRWKKLVLPLGMMMVLSLGIGLGYGVKSVMYDFNRKINTDTSTSDLTVDKSIITEPQPNAKDNTADRKCTVFKGIGSDYGVKQVDQDWWIFSYKGEQWQLDYRDDYALRDFVDEVYQSGKEKVRLKCPNEVVRIRQENRYILRWGLTLGLLDLSQAKLWGVATMANDFPLNTAMELLFHPSEDLLLVQTAWEHGPWLEYLVDFSTLKEDFGKSYVYKMPLQSMTVTFGQWTDVGVEVVAKEHKELEYLGEVTGQQCIDQMMNDFPLPDLNKEEEIVKARSLQAFDIGGVDCVMCNDRDGHGCYGLVREYIFGYKPGDGYMKLISDTKWSGERK